MSDITGATGLDYELDDEIGADTPDRMKALAHPVRLLIADLVLERSMTVTELAAEVGRPRGSVAYHVDVLVDAGLLKVVRTRRVRAIDERFYGRVARTFRLDHARDRLPFVNEAASQLLPNADDELHAAGSSLRHARIPAARAHEYIERLHALALEFSAEPRSGDQEYALMFHVFPTNRFRIAPGGGAR